MLPEAVNKCKGAGRVGRGELGVVETDLWEFGVDVLFGENVLVCFELAQEGLALSGHYVCQNYILAWICKIERVI